MTGNDSVSDEDICCVTLAWEGKDFIPHTIRVREPSDPVKVIPKVAILIHLVHKNLMITRHCPVLGEEIVVDFISSRFCNSETVFQTLLTSPVEQSKRPRFGNKELPRGDILAAVSLFRRSSR